jgi:D-alanyl-D-alanine carboxypeptidase
VSGVVGRVGVSVGELRRRVAWVRAEAGYVGVSVEVRDGERRAWASAGVAELGTDRAVPCGARIRAASATKAFVATVVLHLVAEGRMSLADTVEDWLPGVLTGNGNDGSALTVRHLLQHTSGLHDYLYREDTGLTAADFARTRFDHVSPERLVAGTVAHAPDFPPADPEDPAPTWAYSNANYYLAGLIIRAVTGDSWEAEVRRRIIVPLGLAGTHAPGDDPTLPAPYTRAYQRFPGSDEWVDTTERNMSFAHAAGALVTTKQDLDVFFTALLAGGLLPEAQLARMRDTVPVNEQFRKVFPGLEYGLGLMRQPLPCGGARWGHGGDVEGTTVRVGVTADGERSIVLDASGTGADWADVVVAEAAVRSLMDAYLCAGLA